MNNDFTWTHNWGGFQNGHSYCLNKGCNAELYPTGCMVAPDLPVEWGGSGTRNECPYAENDDE